MGAQKAGVAAPPPPPRVYTPIKPPESCGDARAVATAVLAWAFSNADYWVEKSSGPSLSMVADAFAKPLAQLVATEKIGDLEGSGSVASEMDAFTAGSGHGAQ